jgi:DNA anti-recombination protein RmuC
MATVTSKDIQELKDLLSAMRQESREQMISLREENREQISSLREETREQMISLREENREQISSLREETREQLDTLKEDNRKQIETLREENNQQFANLQKEITEVKIVMAKIEGTIQSQAVLTQKIPDLIEKVGELKNWKQIAIVAITAFTSATITWFIRGGDLKP